MPLFSFFLQESLKSADSYIEVKETIPAKPLTEKYKVISVKASVDVKIHGGSTFTVKKYAIDPDDAKFIKIQLEVSDDVLSINAYSEKENIKAYVSVSVPNVVKSIIIDTNNSDICLKKLDVDSLKLKALNGDISVLNVNFIECISQTSSGDINIHLGEENCLIKAATNSGDTILRNVKSDSKSKRTLKCNSKSGDIIISH